MKTLGYVNKNEDKLKGVFFGQPIGDTLGLFMRHPMGIGRHNINLTSPFTKRNPPQNKVTFILRRT